MNEWISCKDELPEKNDVYLVTWMPNSNPWGRTFMEILEFADGEWVDDIPQAKHYGDGKFSVLAWMPLPDPYKEKLGGDKSDS